MIRPGEKMTLISVEANGKLAYSFVPGKVERDPKTGKERTQVNSEYYERLMKCVGVRTGQTWRP